MKVMRQSMENSMGFDEGRSPCEEEAGRCRIKVALYLPLGKKRSPWRGIGGAEHRLCSIFSGMDEEAYDVKIVIRGYNPEEEMRGYLEKYVSHWSMVEYVSSHYALMRYLVKEHFDVVCYDDCMMLTKDGILAACLARSKRLLMQLVVQKKMACTSYAVERPSFELAGHLVSEYQSHSRTAFSEKARLGHSVLFAHDERLSCEK